MMNKILINATVSAVVLVFSFSCDSGKNKTTNDETIEIAKDANDSTFDDRKEEKDADFIVNAVAGNLGEIKIAQLAKNKSADKAVLAMAARIEEQHMKLLNELKAYADKNGIAIPLQETDKDAKKMSELSETQADEFDKQWCDAMEDRHEESINKFEARMDKTEDPELKEWIATTLPGLKEHLSMIEELDKQKEER